MAKNAIFDISASQRVKAYELRPETNLQELGVETPNLRRLESGACAQNVLVQPYRETTSAGSKVAAEELGIKLCNAVKEPAIPSDPCNKTTNGKPVCTDTVPPLASWLGELPIGLCAKDGLMMRILQILGLANEWPPDTLETFILQTGQTLESIRKMRNEQAHDVPRTWHVDAEKWNHGIKELQHYGYISPAEGEQLTKFYHFLLKSKFHITRE